MTYILEGFKEAFRLLISMDMEIYQIIGLSLLVSGLATVLATFIFVPLGVYLGTKKFRYKNMLSRIIYTSMSIPTVIIGLVVALMLSRRGPFGSLQLLYTPKAMVIAQTILVIPLILGLTYNLAKTRGPAIKNASFTLGGRTVDTVFLIMRELRVDIMVNVATAFSRAISEVGAVMIVGGNIKGQTRVMTTTISMMNSMGDYPTAIALGTILLLISFVIHSLIYSYGQGDE